MTDQKNALEGLSPKKPTLKDQIREWLPTIEEARANKVPWRDILEGLARAGVVIEPPLLANYVCELRKDAQPPEVAAKVAKVRKSPSSSRPITKALNVEEPADGGVAGDLMKWPSIH